MAGIDRKIFYWLLGLNVAIFVAVRVCAALDCDILTWLALPGGWSAWVRKPWTLATYMVTQYDFLHLLFNMLWLWTFYTITRHMAIEGTPLRRGLLPVAYAAGGITAGIVFVSTGTGLLVGSSAAVVAFATAVAVCARRRRVNMALFGDVPLSILTAVVIVLVIVGAPSPISHAAGALAGVAVALWPKLMLKVSPRGRLDRLEKRVRRDGFKSLNPTERSELFYLSQRYKK